MILAIYTKFLADRLVVGNLVEEKITLNYIKYFTSVFL